MASHHNTTSRYNSQPPGQVVPSFTGVNGSNDMTSYNHVSFDRSAQNDWHAPQQQRITLSPSQTRMAELLTTPTGTSRSLLHMSHASSMEAMRMILMPDASLSYRTFAVPTTTNVSHAAQSRNHQLPSQQPLMPQPMLVLPSHCTPLWRSIPASRNNLTPAPPLHHTNWSNNNYCPGDTNARRNNDEQLHRSALSLSASPGRNVVDRFARTHVAAAVSKVPDHVVPAGLAGESQPARFINLETSLSTSSYAGNNHQSPSRWMAVNSRVEHGHDCRTLLTGQSSRPTTVGQLPAVLARVEDDIYLTPHQAYLRQQMEVFGATMEDTMMHVRGRNKTINLNQVGVRCKHCAHVPPMHRAKGSSIFPISIQGFYQAAQNICAMHLQCGLCPYTPNAVKEHFALLLATKTRASGSGRSYWTKCAQNMDLVDTAQGVYLRSMVPSDVPITDLDLTLYRSKPKNTTKATTTKATRTPSKQEESKSNCPPPPPTSSGGGR